ncbi:hypothetical protein GBAR_LOCUS27714, partial [Geodia barretti]
SQKPRLKSLKIYSSVHSVNFAVQSKTQSKWGLNCRQSVYYLSHDGRYADITESRQVKAITLVRTLYKSKVTFGQNLHHHSSIS